MIRKRKERDTLEAETQGRRSCGGGAETGVVQLHSRDTKDGQWPAETGGRHGAASPSRPPEGTNPAGTPGSDFWPPQAQENKFCCYNPPSVWQFVPAALGSEYKQH